MGLWEKLAECLSLRECAGALVCVCVCTSDKKEPSDEARFPFAHTMTKLGADDKLSFFTANCGKYSSRNLALAFPLVFDQLFPATKENTSFLKHCPIVKRSPNAYYILRLTRPRGILPLSFHRSEAAVVFPGTSTCKFKNKCTYCNLLL